MRFRKFELTDKWAMISLWEACDLLAQQNDPGKDVHCKPGVSPELFPVGEHRGEIVASVMGEKWL